MSMAMRRGRRPLTWGADQGPRLVDSQGEANHTATGAFAGPGEPAIVNYRLGGSKSSTCVPMFAAGLPIRREAGVAHNFSR
jgi:hypothetical protein